jgi:hypothetical protein
VDAAEEAEAEEAEEAVAVVEEEEDEGAVIVVVAGDEEGGSRRKFETAKNKIPTCRLQMRSWIETPSAASARWEGQG